MDRRVLPPELISLVHHIELDKSGWLGKATQGLATFAIWLNGNKLSASGIQTFLKEELAVELGEQRIVALLEPLCKSSALFLGENGEYKIPEERLLAYERELKEGEEVDAKARSVFSGLLGSCCPGVDAGAAWQHFLDKLLMPLVNELGAKLYELITGTAIGAEATSSFREFLNTYDVGVRPGVRDAVIAFLAPGQADVRSFVLRHLNAYFFLQASSLPEDAVEALTQATRKKPVFKVFVDTNFLFSVLGIHENPSNEAAMTLLDLISRVHEGVEVRLYALRPTLDETRRALASKIRDLGGLQLPQNLATGALASGLTGLVRRYAEECLKTGVALSAEDFFEPFLNDLMTILHGKGIKPFSEEPHGYSTRPDVIDDILEVEKRENARQRPKTYAEIAHDMVLWHFTQDRRPANLESPVGAQYWVVTIDYRFLAFDASKTAQDSAHIPTCLHPAALVQMLQLWVPRDEACERAVLGTMRLPFLFQAFDAEAERVTINILKQLTRYEKSEELTTETVQRVLLNGTLRHKMLSAKDPDEQEQLIREALVIEDRLRSERQKAALTEAERAKQEASHQRESAERASAALRAKEAEASELVAKERRLRQESEAELATLKAQLEEADAHAESIRRFQGWSGRVLALHALAGAAVWFVMWWLQLRSLLALSLASGAMAAGLWVLVVDRRGSANLVVREWRPYKWLHSAKRWLYGVLGVIVLGVVTNAIYDWLRAEGYLRIVGW